MTIGIKDFALKIGVETHKIIEIAKLLKIKKTVLDDEAQQQIIKELNKGKEKMVDERELKLKQFHEKIILERDKLKQEQEQFEAYKKSEERKLQEKFIQNEINHKTKLEELKIKEMSKLKEDFLNIIQNNDSVKKYSSSQLLNNLIKSSQNKDVLVILMHDTKDVSNSSIVLKDSIKYLKDKGYIFKNFYDIL